MEKFQLDPRLTKDCIHMGQLPVSELLLMNNAHYLWFILVPRTEETEFYTLHPDLQAGLIGEVNAVSSLIKQVKFGVDKINVASLGNIVRQLHIHIVGRQIGDPAWPNVVWGSHESRPYTREEIAGLRSQLDSAPLEGLKMSQMLRDTPF